jgi:hypothetical protein
LRYGVTVWISASVDQRYEGASSILNELRDESFQVSSKVYAEADRSDEPRGRRMTDKAAEETASVAEADVKCEGIFGRDTYGRRVDQVAPNNHLNLKTFDTHS